MRWNKTRLLKRMATGVVTGVAMGGFLIGPVIAVPARATGEGLYGTLSGIYGAAQSGYNTAQGTANSLASGSTTLGQAVNSVAQTAGNVAAGAAGAAAATTGGTTGRQGTATVNGRRVIEYYPIGHYETYVTTYATGGGTVTQGGITQNGTQTVQRTQRTGSAQLVVDDETYKVKISGGNITVSVSDNSATKSLPDAGTVEFVLNDRTLTVTLNNDQFTARIGDQSVTANLSYTTSDVSGNSTAPAPVVVTPAGAQTVVSSGGQTSQSSQRVFVRDINALESDPVGPLVNTVTLAESYHENYQIYEERFSDLYAIYTNLANGSVTNRPAIFDVPDGISVRMTKDGKEVGFANKEQIKEEGTYVAQFYVTQDGSESLPGWQQTIERARFIFRIQYTAGLDGSPLQVGTPSELSSFADLAQREGAVILPGNAEAEAGAEGSPQAPEASQAQEAQQTQQAPEETAPAPEEGAGEPAEPSGLFAPGGLTTSYDEEEGRYRIALLTGDSFLSSIPVGMVTNNAVTFFPSDVIRYELYRGKEAVEYTPGEPLSVAGEYTLIPVIDNLDYESYYRMNRPMMNFRIVTGTVGDLGAMTAPEGTEIAAVRFNGEDVTKRAMLTEQVASLSEDGAWEVDLTGGQGKETVYITRDTKPPVVSVTTEPNAARITYGSEDIADATLYRGEQLVSEGRLVTLVTDVGRYRLNVRDVAGNETARDFSVQYRINVFAIIAIVSVIGLIGALVIFLLRLKTSVRVR